MKALQTIRSSRKLVTLVWILGLIILWECGAFYIEAVKRTPENVLPHLWQIIASVFSTKVISNGQTATQIVLTNAGATLLRAGYGFLIGMAGGFLLAILMKLSGIVEKVAFPYLMLIQMIPILGMAPIVLAITKDIGVSRIVIAAILTFYPVCTNTLAGLKSVEQEKLDLMYLCAANRYQVYWKTLIPTCIPFFFTGLKISAPMAITASILVDTLQGDGGLGCMLSQSLKHAMSIYVFWQIVFLSAFVGVASSWLMGLLERRFSPQKRLAARKGA
ncbi:MAG: ABC-type transporter, integral rane subunit [Oscillospiraceae bacterium]|nr:ABC-type transporter, integral rane subunit [Oscillospiraceae bacterium]